ncbi:hypothetical protein [Pseudobacteriovorax antillogorgiicola]|uniref:Uncharacterized protein n=1 Tax=Pseudobacteriovorax antillogorgiicola TaxID=1513793 RepID=A0A1Y6CGV7_9BACT|nr:hypothetical protein [Pseudobacteriovorax antillogorgiicola]TCS48736.1 hypothetical protein EDD56_117158 [Pseudobacteriovorax antillogorgiicola]SMF54381.1 hypothetical protein SAMN06296036_1171 [Pseudobacteriovorax antillogorgiicola]
MLRIFKLLSLLLISLLGHSAFSKTLDSKLLKKIPFGVVEVVLPQTWDLPSRWQVLQP